METKIFSVYDTATAAYMQPFFTHQNASAIRMIVQTLKDPNSMCAQHPKDFTLYCIGHFDDQTGIIIPINPNELVGKLVDYLDLSIGGTRAAYPHPETDEET